MSKDQLVDQIKRNLRNAVRTAALELRALMGKEQAEDMVVAQVVLQFPDVAVVHAPNDEDGTPYLGDIVNCHGTLENAH